MREEVFNGTEDADLERQRRRAATITSGQRRRAAVVVFSHYPSDPRPRRAAEALVQSGMDVDLICLREEEREPVREVFHGVHIRRLPLKRRRGGALGYVWQYASFLTASFVLLSWRSLRRRYSLVHVHNMPDVLVFTALIPKLLGARVILDLHDPMPELMMTIFGLEQGSFAVRILKHLEKRSIKFADAVLVVNLACKRIFSGRSCLSRKVHVIMNSPDEGIFRYRALPQETQVKWNNATAFVIMYHGSLVERHGLDIAVQALARIKPSIPKAELRIYGRTTPFLEQVMRLARESGLQDSVRCFGGKKLEEIAKAIRDCDLGIIPNRRSIFTEINTPTRIFEYLSQGKPVIAPAAPGIQDYFGQEDLIFFQLGNAEDLAEKIHYVFSHWEQTEAIVRRGQEVYLAHQWRSERRRFLDLVDELLRPANYAGLEATGAQYVSSGHSK
jgi:glycosyltransferase involved in cell wall biosynthesis